MYSYSIARATCIGSLIAAISYFGMKAAYLGLWGRALRAADLPGGSLGLLAAVFIGVMVHEFIHFGVAKLVTSSGPGMTTIEFRLRQLLPHVKISVAISVRQYRAIAVAPLVLLGILPGAAGLLAGEPWLSLFSALMIGTSAGDLLVLFAIRSLSPHARVKDDPERVGCKLA